MACLVVTPEMRELKKSFPGESEASIKNMVGLWQESQIAQGKNVTIDSVPDVDSLRAMYDMERKGKGQSAEAVITKEDIPLLTVDGNLPAYLTDLADRLGVKVSLNKKKRTLSVVSKGATSEELRLFKAIAIDIVYRNDRVAEIFGMKYPKERLAAIIDWEAKNKNETLRKKGGLRFDVVQAKRNLYADYGISTNKSRELMRRKVAESFTSKERGERVAEIVDWFGQILTDRYEARRRDIADRIQELEKKIESGDSHAAEALSLAIGDLRDELSSLTRRSFLLEIGPDTIFAEVKQKLQDLHDAMRKGDASFINALKADFNVSSSFARRNLPWYKDQLEKFLDNFEGLLEDVSSELETAEQIRMTIRDEQLDGPDSEGETTEETDTEGIENQYKETWMYEYDSVSNWSMMQPQVRHMLYKCPLGNSRTRFGSSRNVPAMEVLNTLMGEMQGVFTSKDMLDVLEYMKPEYPWAQYILEQIKDDPQLKTQLFRSISRYQQQIGIVLKTSKDGDLSKMKLKILNSGNTTNAFYTAVQNQIMSGVPLNKKLSIYSGEELNPSHIDRLIEIVEKYKDEDGTRIATATPDEVRQLREEYPDLISDINTILTSIGFAVTESNIKLIAARETSKGIYRQKNNLAVLLSNAALILNQIKDNGYKTTDDIINERKDLLSKAVFPYYKVISQTLTLAETAAVEPSVRENSKVRYTYVFRSTLDDLITGLQGKVIDSEKSREKKKRVNKSISQFIEDRFGDDPYYAERAADGTITYRNYILEMLADSDNAISGSGLSLVNVLTSSTATKDKEEQKNLKQRDRLNTMWSMYNMDDSEYENTKGHWFNIPLPSDSGRMMFIRFSPIGTAEERKEVVKKAILRELERMTDTRKDGHLPETYNENRGKFCEFEILNDVKLAKYELPEIIKQYKLASNTKMFAKLDEMVSDLADVVLDGMVRKFEDENLAFYKERVKDQGKSEVDATIQEMSLFQMAINELTNGDPAYYGGYTDEQKRGKQIITPLDHIDIFNEDFLKAYKEIHGIAQDKELTEEEIVEHALYIEDPVIASPSIDELRILYENALADELIDEETYHAFIDSSENITYTDGQVLRSFDSMRALMFALGEMKEGDELDSALLRISGGEYHEGDAGVVRSAIKSFTSGLAPTVNPDGTTRLMPVQHKCSEQILTAALLQASKTLLGKSSALSAIADLMKEEGIDTVVFTSAVKVGQNGAVDFGKLDVDTASKEEILGTLRKSMKKYRRETGLSIIHKIPYSLYGIVAKNPTEGLDEREVPIGTQIQKLLPADLPEYIETPTGVAGGKEMTVEKAVYKVDGVGELSRKEVIALYNKLMTEKILREYQRMKGTFADKEELSQALQRSCKNSSRNSGYLERAFSLDENGNFVIPLCDFATLNMSSEFLNSLVRNAVSRLTLPGKQLVSMTAFGFASQLKIEFEYDKDGDPIALKNIQCLLPAWSRHIIAKCVDDNGVIDFDKLNDESPDLAYTIAGRIPTQFKSFILPLKCVGFLPPILGDSVVTSIDSVVLQDSDFDNDKLLTFFPSFTADYYIDDYKNKARQDFYNYSNDFYDFKKLNEDYKKQWGENESYTFQDFFIEVLNDPERSKQYLKEEGSEPVTFDQWFSLHEDDYLRKTGPEIKYARFDRFVDISKQTDEQIDNGLINVMRGMMSSKSVSTMSLAAGSPAAFDPIINKIRKAKGESKYPDSPADISTRISYETRNNDGKQMIAVQASTQSAQALLQHTDIKLMQNDTVDATVSLWGETYASLHEVQMKGSKKYISRTIGTGVGAAADNAKSPRLYWMNMNLSTASAVSAMENLGMTPEVIATFLNIPSIRHYTDTGNTGEFEEPDKLNLVQKLPGTLEYAMKTIAFNGDVSDMSDEMKQFCDDALSLFFYLSKLGERLHKLNSLARGDSGSTSPHGPVWNNLARMINYELFQELEEEDPLIENWRDLLNYEMSKDVDVIREDSSNPVAQAYITYGVVGAFEELSKYFPGIADPNFRNEIKNIIKKYHGGVASERTMKFLMYSVYDYMMSSYDCMCKGGLSFEESRNYYMNFFPEEAAEFLSEHPEINDMLMFKRMRVFSTSDKFDPFISLIYDGTMQKSTRDMFTSNWQQLFYSKDEKTREFALDLFKYSFFRNCFAFTNGSYAHLAPAEARVFFPGYTEMLNAMLNDKAGENWDNFDVQYARNMMHDKRFCPTVALHMQKPKYLDKDGNPRDIITIGYKGSEEELDDWYYPDIKSSKPRNAFVITKRSKGETQYLYYVKTSDNDLREESTYALTTPLGWAEKAFEYSATESGATMQSVYDQSDVALSINPRRKRAGRNVARPVSQNQIISDNSSEEPNEGSDIFNDYQYEGFWASYLTDEGYEEVKSLDPNMAKSKKYLAARKSFLAKNKKNVSGKTAAKSKEQISRDKDGGKKTKTKYSLVAQETNTNSVLASEVACASTLGAYTIFISDDESGQLGSALHGAVSRNTHWVDNKFELGNAREIANDLRSKLSSKKVKSVVLNLTGSHLNTLSKYASQEDIDDYVMGIYSAIKNAGIFVEKVISTAQPGIALASARAALKLGYNLEIHHTPDFKVYGKQGEAPTVDKSAFLANLNTTGGKVSGDDAVYDREDGPFIIAKNYWTRDIVLKDKRTLYVFTDNGSRTSGNNRIPASSRYSKMFSSFTIKCYPGSTSAVARGADNAFPLTLKKTLGEQWTDADRKEFAGVISEDVDRIINAFRDENYKRVVLPVGGVFNGPLADISKERTPKLYSILEKEMERLQDAIITYSEEKAETEDEDNGIKLNVKTDDSTLLTIDMVDFEQNSGTDSGNVFVIDTNALQESGIKIYNSDGEQLQSMKMFLVSPKGKNPGLAEVFKDSKIFTSEGRLITEDLQFSVKGSNSRYSILSSHMAGSKLSAALSMGVASRVYYVSEKNLKKAGFTWYDDDGNPIC